MITVFVDESGDLGLRGDRYFVIALIVPQRAKRVVNFMKEFCVEYDLKEVKASLLSFPQKQHIFNKLTSANDYTVSYIVADKKNIDNHKLFQDKNLLYNYLFSFLIKKTIKSANEDVTILLDNHSTKTRSINSLCDYIKIKAFTQWNFKHNLHIGYIDSKDSKMIQAIDVVANAIYARYIYGRDHFYNLLTISESIQFPQNRFGQDIPITIEL
jgi:hypothetical protein